MDNLGEMDKILEKYNILKLNQEETQNMNRPITTNEIEEVNFKKSQQTKALDWMALQVNVRKHSEKN